MNNRRIYTDFNILTGCWGKNIMVKYCPLCKLRGYYYAYL